MTGDVDITGGAVITGYAGGAAAHRIRGSKFKGLRVQAAPMRRGHSTDAILQDRGVMAIHAQQ